MNPNMQCTALKDCWGQQGLSMILSGVVGGVGIYALYVSISI